MVLVALDTNVVDLVEDASATRDHVDAMEAMSPPPRFRHMPRQLEGEVWASYWLVALAPVWRSTLYTFSDSVYEELAPALRASQLLRTAVDVLVREQQDPEYWRPDPAGRPGLDELTRLGVKVKDAVHVADAIALHCDVFLTNDKRLRSRCGPIESRWSLKLRRPSEFLVEAVRSGAPWTAGAPWPWETLARIRAGRAGASR
jgi:hypothetical protein